MLMSKIMRCKIIAQHKVNVELPSIYKSDCVLCSKPITRYMYGHDLRFVIISCLKLGVEHIRSSLPVVRLVRRAYRTHLLCRL